MSPVFVNDGKSSPDGVPGGTYGFIGIGVMGYGMAANLRAKLPKSSKLIICEVNQERREKFLAEQQGLLEVAHSPRELVEKAVSDLPS
jgi:3-hydroxyisobutyrate/3-hydroxypropionate dehydrogenase